MILEKNARVVRLILHVAVRFIFFVKKEVEMWLIFGRRFFSQKLVSYKRRWCENCKRPVVGFRYKGFAMLTFWWVPILPLGFPSRWFCGDCKEEIERKTGVFGMIVVFVASLYLLYLALNELRYGSDVDFYYFSLALAISGCMYSGWRINRDLHGSGNEKNLQMLGNRKCLSCDSSLSVEENAKCGQCGVVRDGL